jgi:hypothetical protein
VVGLISQASLIPRVIGRQAGKMLPTRLESSLDQSFRPPPAPELLPDPWGRWALQPGGLVYYEHSWRHLHLVAKRVLHGCTAIAALQVLQNQRSTGFSLHVLALEQGPV